MESIFSTITFVTKKKTECSSCNDLTARLDRLEKRLEIQEDSTRRWKRRFLSISRDLEKANGRISLLEAENKELKVVIQRKDAQIAGLQKKLFGRSTETTQREEPAVDSWEAEVPKKPRGKQRGAQGCGRKIRSKLPAEEVTHDVPDSQKNCSSCGFAREAIPFHETSEEIDISYKIVRVRHKRLKHKKTCKCKNVPAIVTAPSPPKLIPKGLFSTGFWTHVLIEKFLLQRPIARICMSLELDGLTVSEGTIASGLKRITKLFAPLYNAIRAESRQATHWQMDETHWRIFTDVMGKSNHKWWMWVAETANTSVFILDPTRSSDVPKRHLTGIEIGVLTCDRYSAYQPLVEQGIALSFCWAHVRRDFLKLRDGYPALQKFSSKWLKDIDSLFHYNKRRSSSTVAEMEVVGLCERMEREAKRHLKRKELHPEARSVLVSLLKHWRGLTLFLEHPALPLDNNASERALRNLVVGRKNYYGNRSIWGGCLASMLFSIFGTIAKNKADPKAFLRKYLDACAANNGCAPDDIDQYLPWKAKEIIAQA